MAISPQELDAALRPLKSRLSARFPEVKSSHLTEAIAAGLGYKTNAAMRSGLVASPSWQLDFLNLDTTTFRDRLLAFEYPVLADLRMGPPLSPPSPPQVYREWLEQLARMQVGVAHPDYDAIHGLRKRCAEVFAQTFKLGIVLNRDERNMARQWSVGVDHGACLPGWGGSVNSRRGGHINFPGNDHIWNFAQKLPLSNGKFASYQSALVSFPYKTGLHISEELPKAATMAAQIGWTMTHFDEWSWYVPGQTHLVLYRPTTSHEALLAQWGNSFKRWLLENRTRLRKGANPARQNVIDDILGCQHVPLDLSGFQDCRVRYLKEFARHLYDGGDAAMAAIFEHLMVKWAEHASEPSDAAALA